MDNNFDSRNLHSRQSSQLTIHSEVSGFKEFNIGDDKAVDAGSGGFDTEREDLNVDLKKELNENKNTSNTKVKAEQDKLAKLE